MDLFKVVKKFNEEIVSWRVDCYAFVDDNNLIVVRLDGASVVKMTDSQQVNVLLKQGFHAYEVLLKCFSDVGENG